MSTEASAAEARDLHGRFLHLIEVVDGHARKFRGFVQVRSDERGFRKQQVPQGLRGRSASMRGAPWLLIMTGSTTSGQWSAQHSGNGLDDGGGSQRAGFGGLRRKIFEHGLDLRRHERGIEHFNARHAGGVLDSDERDRGGAEHLELVECLQVRLNARASAGSEPAIVRAIGIIRHQVSAKPPPDFAAAIMACSSSADRSACVENRGDSPWSARQSFAGSAEYPVSKFT